MDSFWEHENSSRSACLVFGCKFGRPVLSAQPVDVISIISYLKCDFIEKMIFFSDENEELWNFFIIFLIINNFNWLFLNLFITISIPRSSGTFMIKKTVVQFVIIFISLYIVPQNKFSSNLIILMYLSII